MFVQALLLSPRSLFVPQAPFYVARSPPFFAAPSPLLCRPERKRGVPRHLRASLSLSPRGVSRRVSPLGAPSRTMRGMPRYRPAGQWEGHDRVWRFLASLEMTEKGCHPERKRGVPRHSRAPLSLSPRGVSPRRKPRGLTPGGAVPSEASYGTPSRAFFVTPNEVRGASLSPGRTVGGA